MISQTILFTREDIRRHENVAIRTPIGDVARERGLSDTFIHARISIKIDRKQILVLFFLVACFVI